MVKKAQEMGQAVGHLLENAGLRSIGNTRIDFQAAIHGAGMQNQRIRTREPKTLGRELVLQYIFLGSERGLVKALGLHTKDDDYVGAIERFVDVRHASNIRCKRFQLARHPHGRTVRIDSRTEFAEKMDVGTRYAAGQDVAKNGDAQTFQFSLAVADGKRVEQGLGGMSMGGGARI